MKIAGYRQKFTVYMIDFGGGLCQRVKGEIERAGYRLKEFHSIEAAELTLTSEPPHIVLFDGHRLEGETEDLMQFRGRLPETHFFPVVAVEDLNKAEQLLSEMAYDFLPVPKAFAGQWVRLLDHAVAQDLIMYSEETKLISEEVDKGSPVGALPNTEGLVPWQFSEWFRQISDSLSEESAVHTFDQAVRALLPDSKTLYLRYLPNRRILLATHGGLQGERWRGMGLNLNELPHFRVDHLSADQPMAEIVNLFRTVYGEEPTLNLPLVGRGLVRGIYLAAASITPWQKIELGRLSQAAGQQIQLLDLQSYLHAHDQLDLSTNLLNRSAFLKHLDEEIVRARRIQLPVSLVLIYLDQFQDILKSYDLDETNLAFRAIAKILNLRSRRVDWVGRLREDCLGVILPHTSLRGASSKAEKTRKLVAAANFSSVLRGFSQLTLTLGASEYPSCARDAVELLESADGALAEVRSRHKNKTCLAVAQDGFRPDFLVT